MAYLKRGADLRETLPGDGDCEQVTGPEVNGPRHMHKGVYWVLWPGEFI